MSEEKEEGKMPTGEPTEAQKKQMRKQQAAEFSEYKKRLRENVEMKRLQNEELVLNIQMYKNRKEFRDLQPKIQELEALEQADLLKAQEEYRKAMEEKVKGGTVEEDKPKIVTAKMGKQSK